MLGQAFMRSLSSRKIMAEGADIQSEANAVDITSIGNTVDLLNRISPDIVIHAAAYTDVDGCELNPDKAYLVNGEGTKNVAEACKGVNAFLIYISTDFVFDGTKKTPYTEEDKPNPINIYGKSKLMGEDFVKEILDNYLIIRTSWLFGKGGKNFVDTIIAKAKTEKKLKVVDDQMGSPTYIVDLADTIVDLQLTTYGSPPGGGPYLQLKTLNITNSGSCSWYEFAKETLKVKGMGEVILEPATSEEIIRPARRPKMSALDNSGFVKVYGRELPSWQDALHRHCAERDGTVKA